jgi:MFS family permease
MPVFVSNITKNAGFPESLVFAIFVLNSGGAVAGYFFAGNRSSGRTGRANFGRIVVFRSLLAFLLTVAVQITLYNVALVTAILILMGFAYAIFLVSTLSLSMELIPAGKAGLFNVLIGIGGACGSFIGPFIAQAFESSGFIYVFITSGFLFLASYVAFRIYA